ncbi:MAG: TlpA disulfide reductase family protein [Chromatiales bacterium]
MTAILLLLSLFSLPLLADESLALSSGNEISFTRFGVDGDSRLLFFPSDNNATETETAFAKSVAELGVEVIYPHLHASYFIASGSFSLNDLPLDDIVELIERIHTPDKKLFIAANEHTVLLVLQAMYEYQRRGKQYLPDGLIFFSPYLEKQSASAGSGIDYHPVVFHSNLPVYIFQPKSSSRFYYLKQTIENLSQGGSPVFAQVIADTRDAYHIWQGEITDNETRERARLPRRLKTAMRLLQYVEAAPFYPAASLAQQATEKIVHAGMHEHTGDPQPPALTFANLHDGKRWSLDEHKGEVVLLNFWATWCPPCVRELPSLGRLHERMQGKAFRIISVDVGEDEATIRAFLQKNNIRIDFPVLMDENGKTVQDWKITGFPTNYMLDKNGLIRYGLVGALEWDDVEVIELINSLL